MDRSPSHQRNGPSGPAKSYPKHRLLPQGDNEALEPVPSSHNATDRPPRGRDKAATQAEHQPAYLTIKAEIKQLGVINMTFGRTWTIEQDIPDRSTDREGVPRHATTATYSDVTNLVMRGLKTTD